MICSFVVIAVNSDILRFSHCFCLSVMTRIIARRILLLEVLLPSCPAVKTQNRNYSAFKNSWMDSGLEVVKAV